MKWKSVAVLFGVLVLGGSAAGALDPTIPLEWQGNNYMETGNTAQMHFTRLGWARWEWPMLPGLEFEFRCSEVSRRFTAHASASIEALQLYSRTPGNKMGQYDPQLTVSIQTDNGGIPSGTSVGSYTGVFPLGVASNGGSEYTGPITVPISASLTGGNVYHVVVECDSLTTYAQFVGSNEDYDNAAYDFRLTCGDSSYPISKVHTYDGVVDDNMMALYYNRTSGGIYENQWVVGSPKATDTDPNGHAADEDSPLFEMFANYDSQTQTVSNPIAGLSQGYSSGYMNAGYSKGRRLDGTTDALGEKFVAHYPTAVPAAYKVRVCIRKDTTSVEADGTLTLEVRDSSNIVLATGTIPSTVIPFDNEYMWAEAELDTPVPLTDGQTYYVSIRSGDITMGIYRVGAHGEESDNDEIFPGKYNSYMGVEAVLVEDYATSGANWTEIDTRDISFALDVVIPGDANGDKSVNVGDLGILGANYGQSPRDWSQGDFNGDGAVNVGDLGILGAHYGEHMPEPATIGLLVLGGLGVLRRRRR